MDVLAQLANIAQLVDDGNPCFIGQTTDNLVYAKDVLALRDAVAELIGAATDDLRSCSEPAGLTEAIIRDKEKFAQHCDDVEARVAEREARLRAALARCGVRP
jgi:hypothetical protein